MKIRYVGPHDEVSIPDLGILAERGKAFDVDDTTGAELLAQIGNYEPIAGGDLSLLTVKQLTAYAEAHDIDLGDATKKADLIKVINDSTKGRA